ncbi:unnamed protein product, partial [Schistocephalus solidus]|uniref:Large ribosomal subunit protein mL62 n=2 Tax=Schistocephalus solidus TaxID=70667 RepID=A0A183TE34_SCHSO
EIEISYSNSSGPGGQHVNKAKTKVEIRFHVASASWIPDLLKPVILEKEANRISKDGFLIMQSDKTRQQLLNQADCLERLRRMVRTYLAQINKPEPPADTVERHQKA